MRENHEKIVFWVEIGFGYNRWIVVVYEYSRIGG
jgi:hypothetical protein